MGVLNQAEIDAAGGDALARGKIIRRNGPSPAGYLPPLYPNPPSRSWAGPGGNASITNAALVPYTGQQYACATTVATTAGTVVTVTGTPYVQRGMAVTHLVDPALSGVPAGTIVVDKAGSTLTLSNPVTVANGDFLGFGNQVVAMLGSVPRFLTQFGTNYMANMGNGGWTRPPVALEFDYYGTALSLRYRDNNTPLFWVWVDGQPITALPEATSGIANSAGSMFRFNLTFNNANDSAARLRRIRIYLIQGDFGGLEIGPTDTISAARVTYEKVAYLGDSWFEGVVGAGYGTSVVTTIPMIASFLLGSYHPLVAGIGGTGYANNGGIAGKAAYSDPVRLNALIAYNPDKLTIGGSINDRFTAQSTVQASATATYQTLKDALPNCRIGVVGVQSRGGISQIGTDYAANNAVKAAATAAGLPFLSPLDEGWLFGSGRIGATTGSGNNDVFMGADGAHLTQSGVEYYARRQAAWEATLY